MQKNDYIYILTHWIEFYDEEESEWYEGEGGERLVTPHRTIDAMIDFAQELFKENIETYGPIVNPEELNPNRIKESLEYRINLCDSIPRKDNVCINSKIIIDMSASVFLITEHPLFNKQFHYIFSRRKFC